MISSNFISRATDTVKDAIGFGVALAISLFLVGFTLFYSVTATLVAVAACISIVLAIELFMVLFVDPNRGIQEVQQDNPYKESWREDEFDNYDIEIKGTKE